MKQSMKRSTVALSTLGAFLTVSGAPLLAAPRTPVQSKTVAAKTVAAKAVAAQPVELTDQQMGDVKGELLVPILVGGVIIAYGAIWCYNQIVADYWERKGREANMGY